MPEGPEVAITADQLSFMKGWELVKVVNGCHPSSKIDPRVYQLPLGSQFVGVSAYGKKLIFSLSYYNIEFGQSLTYHIVCSLGMTGRWSWDNLNDKHTVLEFHISTPSHGNMIVRYTDARLMGSVKVAFTVDEYRECFSNVGTPHIIFLTGACITPEEWRSLITNKRRATMQIGKFIKEPKFASGVGNYLRSEILYECRISPYRQLGQLTDYEIELLRVTTHRIMWEAYKNFGKTLSDFITPDGRRGTYVTKVYPNNIRNPQPTCPLGYPIQHDDYDGQTVHWVPMIQR